MDDTEPDRNEGLTLRQALLDALGRTPEEEAEFWLVHQRRKYDQWWELEESLAGLEELGEASEEDRLRVQAAQREIHLEQKNITAIRNRIASDLYEGE